MVFKARPLDQEQVAIRRFETPLQAMTEVSIHTADDRLRLFECPFERSGLARRNAQYRDFKNHSNTAAPTAFCGVSFEAAKLPVYGSTQGVDSGYEFIRRTAAVPDGDGAGA